MTIFVEYKYYYLSRQLEALQCLAKDEHLCRIQVLQLDIQSMVLVRTIQKTRNLSSATIASLITIISGIRSWNDNVSDVIKKT